MYFYPPHISALPVTSAGFNPGDATAFTSVGVKVQMMDGSVRRVAPATGGHQTGDDSPFDIACSLNNVNELPNGWYPLRPKDSVPSQAVQQVEATPFASLPRILVVPIPLRLLLVFALTPILCRPVIQAGDWPQWRGPGRDGVWDEKGLPDRFPANGLKPRWRQPIGGGYGGVAVTGSRVYVMDRQTQPREVERILCLDADNGKTLWTHEYPVQYGKMEYGNGPRSTPTVHQGRVYTFGAVGHLQCLEVATGKVVWSHDTVKAFQARIPTWGHACSPLLDGDRVLVQVGAPDGCLMAFDWLTGKVLWRSVTDPPGYASPILIRTRNRHLLAYWTPEHIVGVDPDSGKLRWQVPFPITYGVSIADLVWDDETLLASNYWSGSKALKLDADGDNPEVAWEGKQLSLLMSTPLLRGSHVYALDRSRGLKCLEIKTGKVKWEDEHVTPRGRNPQASLVWAGDRALIFNEKGELILARLTPEKYQALGRAAVLRGLIWAHPAFADGCLFARGEAELVCVRLTGP